jgi:hypothetical protein
LAPASAHAIGALPARLEVPGQLRAGGPVAPYPISLHPTASTPNQVSSAAATCWVEPKVWRAMSAKLAPDVITTQRCQRSARRAARRAPRSDTNGLAAPDAGLVPGPKLPRSDDDHRPPRRPCRRPDVRRSAAAAGRRNKAGWRRPLATRVLPPDPTAVGCCTRVMMPGFITTRCGGSRTAPGAAALSAPDGDGRSFAAAQTGDLSVRGRAAGSGCRPPEQPSPSRREPAGKVNGRAATLGRL